MQTETKEIIIITGAGISALFGLPMTSGFTSLIDESSNFQLKELLSDYLGEDAGDIERVMSTLEDCVDENSKNLQEHILRANKYFPVVVQGNYRIDINEKIRETYFRIKRNAQDYLFRIKNEIYNILDNPDIEKASMLYYNILAQIRTKYRDAKISLFTTNYDLSFEKTCRSSKEKLKNIGIDTDMIDYGFVLQDDVLVFDTDKSDKERKHFEYYKLHGSLDWHYDDLPRCTKSGANARPSRPDIMPILYPGVKGKPKKEPFIKLHDIFYNRLQSVDIVIVFGFAFRDPYINELIKLGKMVNKKYKMLYFNPTRLDDLPEESGMHDFNIFFKKDLKYITSKIEVTGNPLKDYLGWGS